MDENREIPAICHRMLAVAQNADILPAAREIIKGWAEELTEEVDRLHAENQRLLKGLEARADGWRKAADLQERHRGNDCATIEWCDAKRRDADEIDALLREDT